MKQIERIRKMEQCLDEATEALETLSAALDKYCQARGAVAAVGDYYGSEDWKHDYSDDEAGRLPRNLKRGVLSEDAAWDMLTLEHDVRKRMRKLLEETGEEEKCDDVKHK